MLEEKKLAQVFEGVVRSAGDLIMEIYSWDDLQIQGAKSSPQTEADRRASALIIQELKKNFPDIPVISEEDKSTWEHIQANLFFLIDPIDGTKEFIKKTGEFTVNIGLVMNNSPIAGVVYAPAINELYLASNQEKAFLNGKEIKTRKPDEDGLDVMVSRSHLDEEKMKTFLSEYKIKSFIKAGSSLKICRVAAAMADLYPRLGPTMEWDTAAAHAVLTAAGGSLEMLDGSAFKYGKTDLKNPEFLAKGFSH